MTTPLAFFIDVDNTLINNDLVKENIRASLVKVLGEPEATHFWQHHDSFRSYNKIVDFPKIIREYCTEKHEASCDIVLGNIFDSINFTNALYPQVGKALSYLRSLGEVVIFTEGDRVYQKQKVVKSGLAAMVDAVLLYDHKLEHIDETVQPYRDHRLVFIDDKVDNLLAIKKQIPKVYLVHVCQGHYNAGQHTHNPAIDLTITSLADVMQRKPVFPDDLRLHQPSTDT